jgi:hypothetical protein
MGHGQINTSSFWVGSGLYFTCWLFIPSEVLVRTHVGFWRRYPYDQDKGSVFSSWSYLDVASWSLPPFGCFVHLVFVYEWSSLILLHSMLWTWCKLIHVALDFLRKQYTSKSTCKYELVTSWEHDHYLRYPIYVNIEGNCDAPGFQPEY